MTLNDKLIEIQTRFKSKKSRFNSFGKYNFRSAEDILEATKPFLKELGVTVTIHEELISSCDKPVIRSTASLNDGKSSIAAQAIVGVDLNQKGMQVPQQFGSASSYGKKYALGNLLLIDDTAAADATNTGGSQKTQKPSLEINTEAFKKAVEYIKSGGTIKANNSKYNVTTKAKAELKKYEQV